LENGGVVGVRLVSWCDLLPEVRRQHKSEKVDDKKPAIININITKRILFNFPMQPNPSSQVLEEIYTVVCSMSNVNFRNQVLPANTFKYSL
jgi:hypothetical protein